MSPYEAEVKRLQRHPLQKCFPLPSEAQKFQELLEQGRQHLQGEGGVTQVQEDWVDVMEQIPPVLTKGLAHSSDKEGKHSTVIKTESKAMRVVFHCVSLEKKGENLYHR